jgi:hypothetical protein
MQIYQNYIQILMQIGIISDSHDHMGNIEKAARVFAEKNVAKVIHCGDMIAPFIKRALTPLQGKNIDLLGVYGNNDGERLGIKKILGEIMQIKGDFHEDDWDGKKIAIYHGTDPRILDALFDSGRYDVILTGHTHNIRIEQKEKTLLVNPGETCGYLTGKATCALLDLQKVPSPSAVEIIELI